MVIFSKFVVSRYNFKQNNNLNINNTNCKIPKRYEKTVINYGCCLCRIVASLCKCKDG